MNNPQTNNTGVYIIIAKYLTSEKGEPEYYIKYNYNYSQTLRILSYCKIKSNIVTDTLALYACKPETFRHYMTSLENDKPKPEDIKKINSIILSFLSELRTNEKLLFDKNIDDTLKYNLPSDHTKIELSPTVIEQSMQETISTNKKNKKEDIDLKNVGVAWKSNKVNSFRATITLDTILVAKNITEFKTCFDFSNNDPRVKLLLKEDKIPPNKPTSPTHYLEFNKEIDNLNKDAIAELTVHIDNLQKISKKNAFHGTILKTARITINHIDRTKKPEAKSDFSIYQDMYDPNTHEKMEGVALPIGYGYQGEGLKKKIVEEIRSVSIETNISTAKKIDETKTNQTLGI